MEQKIKMLVRQLTQENKDRSIALNDRDCSEYNHTVLVHKYNNTNQIVKRLEHILNS